MYKPIKEWREDERPRERLLKNGPSALSDSELLAILISTGTKNLSALDLAKFLLDRFQNLRELASRDVSELKSIKGIGLAKAITLSAAFEISRRIQSASLDDSPIFRSPEDVANYFIPILRGIKQERFYVVLLNSTNKITRIKMVTEGTLNASLVHPREVFRFAIIETAASIILIHNHPSGNPTPSDEDINMTRKLVEASKFIDIPILDHIIIAGDKFTSLARLGYIKP
ncbi:MAG: DNA repair protein RadC [Ignavibacteria bacterium]|nr:DNA repair protein RadC [Ignavibacteria bacterium]